MSDTITTARISFMVPLPPAVLRSNNRSFWARRSKAKQDYSEDVYLAAFFADCSPARLWIRDDRIVVPWKKARVTFTWKACHLPDQANVLSNCKALLDILCMAPKSKQANHTTYLGLIEDDRGVEAIGKVEKVAHRHQEGVEIDIEELR